MQRARNKAIAMGVNPDEEQNTNRPPKVNVASKHDRQVDRRTYKEKYDIFENASIQLLMQLTLASLALHQASVVYCSRIWQTTARMGPQ